MKKNFITLLLICFSIFTYAQNNKNPKNEKIAILLNLTGSGNLGVTAANSMLDSFKKALPQVNEDFWDEFKKEINATDLVNLIIPIYDKHYTESEIDELIKFYNTPIGKKMVTLLPTIMSESMEAGRIWGKEIESKVLNRLNEKGIIKN